MIDLKANDKTCIFSTMHFIVDQANKYDVDPILNFDQPLYQKAYEIHWKESENNESFLGSIGHFMSSSSLREGLDTIYGSDILPHMLSGSVISRAFRGHLIVSGVLYATIIPVYECPLQD